jgi:hypothetical protein
MIRDYIMERFPAASCGESFHPYGKKTYIKSLAVGFNIIIK